MSRNSKKKVSFCLLQRLTFNFQAVILGHSSRRKRWQMKCEKCQHESLPGTKFCSNCGTQLIPLEEKALPLTETLLDFYKNNCSSQCYDNIKKDAELMTTYFDNLQSTASNVEIRFKGENQAEATFSNNVSGTSKAGAKQDVLRGVYKWDLEKQGDSWKIIGITFSPRG